MTKTTSDRRVVTHSCDILYILLYMYTTVSFLLSLCVLPSLSLALSLQKTQTQNTHRGASIQRERHAFCVVYRDSARRSSHKRSFNIAKG